MMRALAFVLLMPLAALAASLHEQPIGTRVTGDFALGHKRVFAPASDWTLIASHKWTGTVNTVMQGTHFAGVYLAEIREGRLSRAIQAWTNIAPNLTRGWTHKVDPCKQREKVLAYKNLSAHVDNLFCFDVTELRGYMRKSTAWREQAQQWLTDQKIKLPPTVLVVRFGKLERAYWSEVFYYFEPKEFTGVSLAEQSQSAAQWGDEVEPSVRAGLEIPGP